MSSTQYAISLKTNRLISKSTANYRKLKKMGLTKEIGDSDEATKPTKPQPTPEVKQQPQEKPEPQGKPEQSPEEPEFDEKALQHKIAELSTSMVASNVKQIVSSQKLSDKEYDTLLRKMLYRKLCIDSPNEPKVKPKKTKAKKRAKFRVITPQPSESESESESE